MYPVGVGRMLVIELLNLEEAAHVLYTTRT
jgi:hypothetical protein